MRGTVENGRERVLVHAEKLFRSKGLASVSLADIAAGAEMKKASLYYHFPDGKQELFVAVHERALTTVGKRVDALFMRDGQSFGDRLRAVAKYLAGGRARIHLFSMMHNDMPDLDPRWADRLKRLTYDAVMLPFIRAITHAYQHGEVRRVEPHSFTGCFLATVESISITDASGVAGVPLQEMIDNALDILLFGLLKPTEAQL